MALAEPTYRIVELIQGSDAWFAWRNLGLGASEAPILMGENPWKKRSELLKEKHQAYVDRRTNYSRARGAQLEPFARKRYSELTQCGVAPACLESLSTPWLRASVDGISGDGQCVVEIKCGESAYKKTSATGEVPRLYYGQVQHILAVTGLCSMDFFCYLPGRKERLLKVSRDDSYIARLLVEGAQFMEELSQCRK